MCSVHVRAWSISLSVKAHGHPFFSLINDCMSCMQVEEWTAVVESSIPDRLKHAPNAKMFLRSFWYRAMISGIIAQDEMHVYALARCIGRRPTRQ